MKPKTVIIVTSEYAEKIFSDFDLERLRKHTDLEVTFFIKIDEDELHDLVRGTNAVISCWDTPVFSKKVLDAAPDLKIIAHAGGSVKPIVTDAVWERGIVVTSASFALSIGVAETALAFILLGGKRMPWLSNDVRNGGWQNKKIMGDITEMFRSTVGIIGAGYVGRHLIRLLKNFETSILLFDPYVSAKEATDLDVEKVELDDLLQRSDFVSVCAPLTDGTRGMMGKKQLQMIKDGAVLINTARGAIFNKNELIGELQRGRFVACLDVTDPEPPAADSPLRKLDNVFLTPHIAGATANNLIRLGSLSADEIINYFSGKPNLYPVKKEMLAIIA